METIKENKSKQRKETFKYKIICDCKVLNFLLWFILRIEITIDKPRDFST
jgi:hypothetical protein